MTGANGFFFSRQRHHEFEKGLMAERGKGGDCLEIRGFEHSRERTRTRISLAGRNELDFPAGLLTAASLRLSPSVGISG